jgi:hypothetical protein
MRERDRNKNLGAIEHTKTKNQKQSHTLIKKEAENAKWTKRRKKKKEEEEDGEKDMSRYAECKNTRNVAPITQNTTSLPLRLPTFEPTLADPTAFTVRCDDLDT